MNKLTNKKVILSRVLLVVLLASGLFVLVLMPKIKTYFELKEIEEKNIETIEEAKGPEKPEEPANPEKPKVEPTPIPKSAYLSVPFICQAPLQTEENWVYHEESCEEAAILQAYLYLNGKTMTKEEADKEILKMESWQVEHFGSHHDIYADEVKNFIAGYYQIPSEDIDIVHGADIDDIKKYISSGYPVIVPIMGNILNNPYYPYPGYHMLVAIGYTEDRIITNDNGTRHGKDFSYDNQIFYDAMTAAGGDIVIIKGS